MWVFPFPASREFLVQPLFYIWFYTIRRRLIKIKTIKVCIEMLLFTWLLLVTIQDVQKLTYPQSEKTFLILGQSCTVFLNPPWREEGGICSNITCIPGSSHTCRFMLKLRDWPSSPRTFFILQLRIEFLIARLQHRSMPTANCREFDSYNHSRRAKTDLFHNKSKHF